MMKVSNQEFTQCWTAYQVRMNQVPGFPLSINTGMNLCLGRQGAEGYLGAMQGNLTVQVIVEDDTYFHCNGMDMYTKCPISLTQAILGGTVDVRMLTGVVEMKIPKGT
jgi:molecular chaperone DnaJ